MRRGPRGLSERARRSAQNGRATLSPQRLALLVLCFCYAAWIVLPIAGMLLYDGRMGKDGGDLPVDLFGCQNATAQPVPRAPCAGTPVKPRELPLYHFDRFFRRAGSGIVLAVLGLRWLFTVAEPDAFHAPQMTIPAAMYAAHAVLRLALYGLHEAGLIFNPRAWGPEVAKEAPHIMSDHILLAASVLAGLASEATLPLLSVRGSLSRAGRGWLLFHVSLATSLAFLVSLESYFTTRYLCGGADV